MAVTRSVTALRVWVRYTHPAEETGRGALNELGWRSIVPTLRHDLVPLLPAGVWAVGGARRDAHGPAPARVTDWAFL